MLDEASDPETQTPSPNPTPSQEETRFLNILTTTTNDTMIDILAPLGTEITGLRNQNSMLTCSGNNLTKQNAEIMRIVTKLSEQIFTLLNSPTPTVTAKPPHRDQPASPPPPQDNKREGKEPAPLATKSYTAAATAISDTPTDEPFTKVICDKKKVAIPFLYAEYLRLNRQVIIETTGPTPKAS